MEIQLHLILTMCFVNFGSTFIVQQHHQEAHQTISNKVDYEHNIRENFENLFDSIAKNDTTKSKSYHEILRNEVARERLASNTVKERLQNARNRNSNNRNSFYEKGSDIVVAIKRKANMNDSHGHEFDTMTSIPVDTSALKASKLPVIWILGGPGSGKGTLCGKIVTKYGFSHVSTGDLLREEVQSGSDRGKEVATIMKDGGLVPSVFVLTLLAEKLVDELPNTKGFLIDGYPRKKSQGDLFEMNIAPADAIIYLKADDSVMLKRLLGRAQTSRRSDDNEDTIRKRLATFHANNNAIIEAFASKCKKINAIQTPEAVFAEATTIIDLIIASKR